jgi:hypothetical protein
VWALGRLLGKDALAEAARARRPAEADPTVVDEWAAALR